MKIGILTFWWSQDNYGQLLQCYALQKYLWSLGHEAFLVRYRHSYERKATPLFIKVLKALNPIKLFKYLIYKIKQFKNLKEQKLYDRKFDDFREKYIICTDKVYNSYIELLNDLPQADAYIVGSDQIWNYNFLDIPRSISYHAYFLDFGNETIKRISYAASWGVNSLPQKVKNAITPLLAKFDYISVREENGVELCKQCGINNAEWVCDPTLLLSADDYRNLYKDNLSTIRKQMKKFLVLYMLGNECKFNIQTIFNWANEKQLDVIYITGNRIVNKRIKFFATIPEWLYLLDNAEYVITNSYHCSVFCTIFNKRFGIIPLTGKDKEMNSRFDSLFELRGIGNHYITEYDFSVLQTNYIAKNVNVSEKFLNVLKE